MFGATLHITWQASHVTRIFVMHSVQPNVSIRVADPHLEPLAYPEPQASLVFHAYS